MDEMKPRMLLLAAALGALMAALPLGAETVSLPKARELALARSLTLQKMLLSVDAAELAEKVRTYDFLPALSVSAQAGAAYPAALSSVASAAVSVSVTQPLYDGGKSALLAEVDRLSTRIAREQSRAAYFSVLEAVDSAWYGVLETAAARDAAAADRDAARLHLSLAEAKREAGMITPADLLKTQSETEAAEAALSQAAGRLAVATATLSSLTGLALTIDMQPGETSLDDAVMDRFASLSDERAAALSAAVRGAAPVNNPSAVSARMAAQKAQKTADSTRTAYLPSAGVSWSNSLGWSSGAVTAGGTLSLSASIPLDVWNTNAAVDAGTITARQAGLEEQEFLRTLELEVTSAVTSCVSAARSAVSARKSLAYAEGNYQGVLERFRISAATSADLSDAGSLVSAARMSLISARSSFQQYFLHVRTLAGYESQDMITALLP
jgi:outer membrane protein